MGTQSSDSTASRGNWLKRLYYGNPVQMRSYQDGVQGLFSSLRLMKENLGFSVLWVCILMVLKIFGSVLSVFGFLVMVWSGPVITAVQFESIRDRFRLKKRKENGESIEWSASTGFSKSVSLGVFHAKGQFYQSIQAFGVSLIFLIGVVLLFLILSLMIFFVVSSELGDLSKILSLQYGEWVSGPILGLANFLNHFKGMIVSIPYGLLIFLTCTIAVVGGIFLFSMSTLYWVLDIFVSANLFYRRVPFWKNFGNILRAWMKHQRAVYAYVSVLPLLCALPGITYLLGYFLIYWENGWVSVVQSALGSVGFWICFVIPTIAGVVLAGLSMPYLRYYLLLDLLGADAERVSIANEVQSNP